jgi:hypothetical protein
MRRFYWAVLVACLMAAMLAPASMAQQSVSVQDRTCLTNSSCATSQGCEGTIFTANATTTYTLKVSVNCTSSPCKYCKAEACLFEYNSAQLIAHVQTTDCNGSNCGADVRVNLRAGVQYKMYCCLSPCLSCGDTGENCHSDCYGQSTCYYR